MRQWDPTQQIHNQTQYPQPAHIYSPFLWPGTGFLSAHVVSTLSVFWRHILTSQIWLLLASLWERKTSEMKELRGLAALWTYS